MELAASGRAKGLPFILIPLYIYPLTKAWEPLFEAARIHPSVQFWAIINPNNGPGQASLPDASYVAALHESLSIPNIRLLGYVHCTYGRRSMELIKNNIDTYRGWDSEFRLEGIFIDEAPSALFEVGFMTEVHEYTRKTWQASLGRAGLLFTNPGVVVDKAYFDHAEYVVVFEQSESHWKRHFCKKDAHHITPEARCKAVAILHTCSASGGKLTKLVQDIMLLGLAGVYVTEQTGGGYTRWPETWKQLSKALEQVNEAI